jgi:hypothetical protein
MLKAALGFMLSHGSRPRSLPGHHIAIIDFVAARVEKRHAALIASFDRLRRKRNIALYDDAGSVSHIEAEEALKTAHSFIETIRADIAARKP